jgi:tetratricopeptide (TPR) repeat protein
MKKTFLPLGAVMAVALVSTGCAKLESRDNLNKGVTAYKNAKYAEASSFFRKAIELDPDNPNARLYLATAYMVQWIPGADSPDNNEFAKNARNEFNKVLEKDPKEKVALASLASLAFNEGKSTPAAEATLAKRLEKFEEAKKWYNKLLEVDSSDKTAYYSLGVIAWENWYPALMQARSSMSMKPEDPGPLKDKKVRAELREKYGATIEEGIKNLMKAIEQDKEYDDAMAYVNLLIRERADLADTKEAYEKDVEVANDWVQKALDAKKAKAARQPTQTGIVQESK